MRYLRYTWSILLLVAAALAPDVATTVTLMIAGSCTVLLAVAREKRLAHLVQELSAVLSLQNRPQAVNSVALERTLTNLQRNMLLLATAAGLVILLALLLADLDITIARNYALLVLVALAPLGLEVELAAILHAHHKRASETVRTAVGYATEDAWALLAVIGLSFIGTLWLHIPPALSALQILVITCIARPLLSGRLLQAAPHKVDRAWRVLFTATIVYGSFVFFFIRHYLEPRYADSINPAVWQATTVALVAFIVCQAALLVFNPKAPRIVRFRGLALLAIMLLIAYLPALNQYFMTVGPAAADWVWIIIAGLLFTALVMLRQRAANHNRSAVLALHRNSREN